MRSSSYSRLPKIATAVPGDSRCDRHRRHRPGDRRPGRRRHNLTVATTPAAANTTSIAATPYMGWSSWSMQSSSYPGLNPNGSYSYLPRRTS